MISKVIAIVAAIAATAAAAPGLSPLHTPKNSKDAVPNRYIVTLEDNEFSVLGQMTTFSTVFGTKGHGNSQLPLINGFAATLNTTELEYVRLQPNVKAVEQVQIYRVMQGAPEQLWGLDRVNQVNRPLDSNTTFSNLASNVDVYVIDTGINIAHEQFQGRAKYFWTGYPGDNSDTNGHGTHCAGTIGGRSTGVAKGTNLYAVKVFQGSSGTNEIIINAMNYVAQNRNKSRPSVASMSLGGGKSAAVNTAINNLYNAGVVPVVAAGNENQDACNVSPASATNAITVGASDISDRKASFSNYGSCVDIIAPGVNIYSSWAGSANAYNTISGTSMATPHVAGAVAGMLGKNPTLTVPQLTSQLLAAASLNKITGFNTATPNKLLFVQ